MTDLPVQQQAEPIVVFRSSLKALKPEIAAALPPQVNPDRFIRTVMTVVQMQPDLLNKDRRTLFAACMKAAQTGLFPDGQDAALVAFGNAVQFMPMVAGLIRLARQSGEILSLSAHCVYENDTWDYELGDNERIVHKPKLDGDRGELIAAYAVGRTKDGGIYREVMSKQEIEKVRNVSRAKNNGPWAQWYERMAEKTVIRRLLKRMPTSTDMQQVLEADNETYDLDEKPTVGEKRIALDPRAALRGLVAEIPAAEKPSPVEDDYSDIPFDEPKETK
jgi:recombination protein RecT